MEGGLINARATNDRTSSKRQKGRQGCFYTSGRICTRRDPPRSGRKTWSSLYQAGNCYRAFQGSPCRRQAETAAQCIGENTAAGRTGLPQRAERLSKTDVAKAVQRHIASLAAGRKAGCIPSVTLATRAYQFAPENCCFQISFCQTSRQNTKAMSRKRATKFLLDCL